VSAVPPLMNAVYAGGASATRRTIRNAGEVEAAVTRSGLSAEHMHSQLPQCQAERRDYLAAQRPGVDVEMDELVVAWIFGGGGEFGIAFFIAEESGAEFVEVTRTLNLR